MANIAYELPETYASVTRPVAYEIIKQLRDNLGIIDKNVRISFPGANGKVTTWNSNNVEEVEGTAQFQANNRIVVDIKEEYIEDDMLTMISRRTETPPIFHDRDLDIRITPVYSRTKVMISFTYRTKNRWEAESFKDYWRRKVADNRQYMVFSARYKYPVPTDIEKALYMLHKLKLVHDNKYPTYSDYIFGHGSEHLVSLTNVAGNGDILAMCEMQENIYGDFSNNEVEIEKDDIGSVWLVTFDFEYHYDKPISMVLHYPLMVYNQLVPPQLYPEVLFDIATLPTYQNLSRQYFTEVERHMGFQWHIRGAYIRIPEFDDWSNYIKWPNYQPLLSAMITIDIDNPRDICNLIDLDKYGLHPALQPSFKRNHMYLNKRREFPFLLELYMNNSYTDQDGLTVDKDLNVTSKYNMSVKKVYHIVISIIRDIRLLTPEAQSRFFKDPQLVYTWLDIISGQPPVNGYPKVHRVRKPSNYYLDDGFDIIKHLGYDPNNINDPNHPDNPNNPNSPYYNGKPKDPNTPDTGNYSNDTKITKELSKYQQYVGVVDIKDFERVVKENNLPGKGMYMGLGSLFATVGIFSIETNNINLVTDRNGQI